MKRLFILTLTLCLLAPLASASKFSHWVNKQNHKGREHRAWQRRQDLNFADYNFKLTKSFVNRQGERCRVYLFNAKSSYSKHGMFRVCA